MSHTAVLFIVALLGTFFAAICLGSYLSSRTVFRGIVAGLSLIIAAYEIYLLIRSL